MYYSSRYYGTCIQLEFNDDSGYYTVLTIIGIFIYSGLTVIIYNNNNISTLRVAAWQSFGGGGVVAC